MLDVLTLYKLERISRPLLNGLLFFVASYLFDMHSFSVLAIFYLFYSSLANISTLGIEGYVKRESGNQGFLSKTPALMALRAIVAVAAILVVCLFYLGGVEWWVIVLLLMVLVLQPIDTIEWEAAAQHRYELVTKSRLMSSGCCISMKMVGLIFGSPLLFIASHLIEQLAQVKYLHQYIGEWNLPSFREALSILNREIAWYFVSVILIVVLLKLDQYFVLKFLGSQSLSVYALGAAVLQIPLLLISNLYVKRYNSLLKVMASRHRFVKWYRSYARNVVLTGLLLGGLTIGGSYALAPWVNYKYDNLSVIIICLSPIIVFTAVAMAQNVYWLYVKKSSIVARLHMISGTLTMVAFFLLARSFSLEQIAVLSAALSGVTTLAVPCCFREGRDMYQTLLARGS